MTLRAEVMSARLAGDRRVTERLARQGLTLITYAGSENIKSDRLFFRDALEWAVTSNPSRRTKQEDRTKGGSRRLKRNLLPGPGGGPKRKSATPTSAAKLKQDTTLVNLLRNAVEAASDEDGWAPLASVGNIITKQHPEFDSRSYGYAKLNELIAATTLFVLDRRSPGDGKAGIIYVRDKRNQDKKPGS
jgi:hypothetical protein